MSPGVALLLWSLVLFEVKHCFCDFVLQTNYQYRNKRIYGHPGGLIHAGIHVVGSAPAILLMTQTAGTVIAMLAAEFVVHYHEDWLKEQINKRLALRIDDIRYWILFGSDQLVHQMTYVVFLFLLAKAAGL
jgi:hypothetical protein